MSETMIDLEMLTFEMPPLRENEARALAVMCVLYFGADLAKDDERVSVCEAGRSLTQLAFAMSGALCAETKNDLLRRLAQLVRDARRGRTH